ncbi:MAG: hypothetical protein RL341_1468 [Pseudomonadota bacterium]
MTLFMLWIVQTVLESANTEINTRMIYACIGAKMAGKAHEYCVLNLRDCAQRSRRLKFVAYQISLFACGATRSAREKNGGSVFARRMKRAGVFCAVLLFVVPNAFAANTVPDAQSHADQALEAFNAWFSDPQQWQKASQLTQAALKVDPDNSTALSVRGRMELAWARRSNDDTFRPYRARAYEFIERALAANPTHPEALRVMGRMRHLDNDYAGAQRYFYQAIDANGLWPALAYNLGLLAYSQALRANAGAGQGAMDVPQAERWFNQVLELYSQKQASALSRITTADRTAASGAAYQLAYLYAQRAQKPEAMRLLALALSYAHPRDHARAGDVTNIYFDLGEYALAEQTASEAFNRRSTTRTRQYLATARIMLAWQNHMQNNHDAGSRWMSKAMAVKTPKRLVEYKLRNGTADMKEAALVYAWRFRLYGYWEAGISIFTALFGDSNAQDSAGEAI